MTTTHGARRRPVRFAAALAVLALVAAACGDIGNDTSEPLDPAAASQRLDELADDIGWVDNQITRSASIPPPTGANLSDTLPPLDEFPLRVDSPDPAAVEIWSSTEKSGEADTSDGWMTQVAEAFNRAGITRTDGSPAQVDLRSIASGTSSSRAARSCRPASLPPTSSGSRWPASSRR
jgi:hypothetical protein